MSVASARGGAFVLRLPFEPIEDVQRFKGREFQDIEFPELVDHGVRRMGGSSRGFEEISLRSDVSRVSR